MLKASISSPSESRVPEFIVPTFGFQLFWIPWSNVKAMMTTEYCPATEIQRMEQELWTLTLKGDDIEAYNMSFPRMA
ncbi:hypothetical protein Tco_0260638 [Tanacetum coccineum]|uniref:Retrotransposon gag domain-containing protein n=1 Tax=Tanacetum coccineum TaxID=301880 RepID=A0ABQ5HN49_9ASTR